MFDENKIKSPYLNLFIAENSESELQIQVKLTDEGVILDAYEVDSQGATLVDSTYKFWHEFYDEEEE